MTTKEYMNALEKGMRKAKIADEFMKTAWQVLGWYFEEERDEEGCIKCYDDGCPILDFTSPKESWKSIDGDSELAKELYEVVRKAIEKWMVALDK